MGITPIYSIPFADPTDLVRDWPALSEDVAEAVEAAVAGVPVLAGIGSNVVQTVKTDTFSTSSTSFVPITDLEVTITPSSATSRILLLSYLTPSFQNNGGVGHFRFAGGNSGTFIGDAGLGNQIRAAFGTYWATNNQGSLLPVTMAFLDSPATASPVTYSIEARQAFSGTVTLGVAILNANDDGLARTPQALIAIEVAA